jgi:D-methionine transport system substrate-binding protein
MKKIKKLLTSLLSCSLLLTCGIFGGCKNGEKTISVCASDIPHAEVLTECVKPILEKQGYSLKVEILDWSIQNDQVAVGDYDANYFQHVPYLETYDGEVELFASCKVHYEPLGIYYGKAVDGTELSKGKTFEICDDVSNAIRAFELLTEKGVINKTSEGENYPITSDGTKLTLLETSKSWTSLNGKITVTLVPENLLVSSLLDYDFACLPCNTALTGSVNANKRVAVEDDASIVTGKANIIAARTNEYKTNSVYKTKIDVLTDAMLSKEVADFFAEKYLGVIVCDERTQIDLRR